MSRCDGQSWQIKYVHVYIPGRLLCEVTSIAQVRTSQSWIQRTEPFHRDNFQEL